MYSSWICLNLCLKYHCRLYFFIFHLKTLFFKYCLLCLLVSPGSSCAEQPDAVVRWACCSESRHSIESFLLVPTSQICCLELVLLLRSLCSVWVPPFTNDKYKINHCFGYRMQKKIQKYLLCNLGKLLECLVVTIQVFLDWAKKYKRLHSVTLKMTPIGHNLKPVITLYWNTKTSTYIENITMAGTQQRFD